MNINLAHLQYFLDAARLQSVTRAAELHRISPSAVSQAIKQLGQSLSTTLIQHSKNIFALTEAGHHLQKEGSTVLDALRKLCDEIPSETKRSAFRFGTTYSIALNCLPKAIKEFQRKSPNVKLGMQFGNRQQVRESIRDGTIDFGIFVDDGESWPDLRTEVLHEGKFVVIAKSKVSLKNVGLVVTSHERPEVQKLESVFKKSTGKEILVAYEAFSWELVKKFSEIGPYAGYVPDYLRGDQLVVFNDSLLPSYQVVICFRRRRPITKTMRLFLSELNW